MDWEKFSKRVEANLDKTRAEIVEHNKRIDNAIRDLDMAYSTIAEGFSKTGMEYAQRALLLSQLDYMRLQWEKEYIKDWS